MVSAGVGFNFSAVSLAKKVGLMAVNTFLMMLGVAVAVLSLYQVKLLPETYQNVVQLLGQSVNEQATSMVTTAVVNVSTAVSNTAPSGLGSKVTVKPDSKPLGKRSPISQLADDWDDSGSDDGNGTDSAAATIWTSTSEASFSWSSLAMAMTKASPVDDEAMMDLSKSSLYHALPTGATAIDGTVTSDATTALPSNPEIDPAASTSLGLSVTAISQIPKSADTNSSSNLPTSAGQPSLSNFNSLLKRLEESWSKSTTNKAPTTATTRTGRNARSVTTPATRPPSLPADLPAYYEEIFNMVQTSLHVCIGAGLLVFLSALLGVCGGLCRVPLCIKIGVFGLLVVMLLEMATAAFIFVAHDKVRNRNKYKDFDQIIHFLCDVGNFCVNPMMLIIIGSFLCVAIILQIGSITLSCSFMSERTDEYAFGNYNNPAMAMSMYGQAKDGKKNGRGLGALMAGPGMSGPGMPMCPPNMANGYPCGNAMMVGGMAPYPGMQMPPIYGYGQPMAPPFFYPQMAGSRPTINIIST